MSCNSQIAKFNVKLIQTQPKYTVENHKQNDTTVKLCNWLRQMNVRSLNKIVSQIPRMSDIAITQILKHFLNLCYII
jgi:hypothetical protein